MKYLFLIVVALFMFNSSARAAENKNLCLKKIDIHEGYRGLRDVVFFKKSPHNVFYLGSFKSAPYLLENNAFRAMKGNFPKNPATDKFAELPDGTVIGTPQIHFKPHTLYLQDKDTGEFSPMDLPGMEKLWSIPEFVWSETMQGILIATQGNETSKNNPNPSAVFLLKENIIKKVEGINGWVTKIVDFPEIKMTFLGTEQEDRIYLIDAQQKVHLVSELNMGKWMYFPNVLYLKNPDRLLVIAGEVMGPKREMYLIPLEKNGDILAPKKSPRLKDIFKRFQTPSKYYPRNDMEYYLPETGKFLTYARDFTDLPIWDFIFKKKKEIPLKLYEVGEVAYEEVTNPAALYEMMPPHLRAAIDENYKRSRDFDLPALKKAVSFEENGLYEIAENKDKKLIGGDVIERPQYLRHNVKILPSGNEAIVPASNGYFLLKEATSSSDCLTQ